MSHLTQREYLWLDDAIHAAQLESKCFADKAQRCQDPAIKDLFNSCSQMHQRHFERLVRYMNSAQGQASQQNQPGFYQSQGQSQGQYGAANYGYTTR